MERSGMRTAFAKREFRALWSTRMASQFADGLLQAALIATVVFSPTQANTALGFAKALALVYVPYSLVGPFVGILIDRWSRRSILVWTPLLRAVCIVPLFLAGEAIPWWAMAPLLVVFSANRFFLATAAAVVPRVVPTEALIDANSSSIVGGTVAAFSGTFVGALLAEGLGQGPLIIATAILWITASFLARRISRELVAHHADKPASHHGVSEAWAEFTDGFSRLRHSPRASWPITSIVLDQFLQGYVIVVSLFVFRDRWEGGIGSYSWLLGAGAVGIFVGLATVGRLGRRLSKERIVALGFALAGSGLLANAILVIPATALVSAGLLGMTFAWKKSTADTMVQEAIPDTYRGRVFSVYDVAFNLARVASALAAVVLLPILDVVGSLLVVGSVSLLWTPVLAWAIRRMPEFALVWTSDGTHPAGVIRGGPEEMVTEIVKDSGADDPARTLRLRLDDGSIIDVVHREDAWSLKDEI